MDELTWVVLARVEDGDSLFADDPITAPMLAEMARVYDPQVRMAPVISGYDPSTNTAGPAHFSGEYTPPLGYVRALDFDGINLWGAIEEIRGGDGQGLVSERVAMGFLQRSIGFWTSMPDFPGKKKPPYLRHLALLGGEPAGIPNLPPLTEYFVAQMGEQNGRIVAGADFAVRHLLDTPRPAVPAPAPPTPKEEDTMTPEETRAAIDSAVAEALAKVAKPDSTEMAAAIGEAVRSAVEPISTQLTELRSVTNQNQKTAFQTEVERRFAGLVQNGRLDPAERAAEQEFLADLPTEKVRARLDHLETRTPRLNPSMLSEARVFEVADDKGENVVSLAARRYTLPQGGKIPAASDMAVLGEAKRASGGDYNKFRAAAYALSGEPLMEV